MIKAAYNAGLSETLYMIFNYIGIAALILFPLLYAKKFKVSRIKMFICAIILYCFGFLLGELIYIIEDAKTKSFTRAIIYLPLMILLLSKLFKIKYDTLCEIFAPALCLFHSINNIGCIFAGCCRGYPSSFGIYNPIYDKILFPIQIIEIIAVFILFLFFLFYQRKKKYNDNLSFPVYLICFGLLRFIFQFLRDNKKLLWGISELGFHSLFMIPVGIALLVITLHKNKRNRNKKENEVPE